jgi:hypothetical protein
MGLLDNESQYQYYTDPSKYGNYQFVTLDNIIQGFMLMYVGENKILTKINRTDVQFHAMRAMQELSYDTFRSVKSQEIEVPNTLKMPLPQDYVNYVKLVKVGQHGIEMNLYPTGKTSNPFAISQDDQGNYNYDSTNTNALEQANSDTIQNFENQSGIITSESVDASDVELDYRGRRYGIDPQHAHQHGSFFIDNLRGYLHFSSNLVNQTIILKYISDGLGKDDEMVVHKFCEEAIYKWIAYAIVSSRSNIPGDIIGRFKMEKFAETRKAKIRLSNIKIEEFAQVLKGLGKQIK